jgi:hypothetical protein
MSPQSFGTSLAGKHLKMTGESGQSKLIPRKCLLSEALYHEFNVVYRNVMAAWELELERAMQILERNCEQEKRLVNRS